jgi:hypothetical protein
MGSPISTSTLDVWVAAVMELYRRPRGDALTSKLDTYQRNHDARKRAAFVDRGLDGIVAGYARCALLRPPGPDSAPRRTRGPLPPSPPRDGGAQRLRCRRAEDDPRQDERLREVPFHGRDCRPLLPLSNERMS